MAGLKQFLVYHGEKFAFALIALLSVWSILGSIAQPSGALRLADEEPYVVEETRILGEIDLLKKHTQSSVPVMERAKVEDAAKRVSVNWAQHAREIAGARLEWALTNQPPLPIEVRVPPPPPPPSQDPEEKWRTAVAAVRDWQVVVDAKRAVVIAKAPEELRYPKRGSVRVALFRKKVGDGREEIDAKVAQEFRNRNAAGTVAKPAEGGAKPSSGGSVFSGLIGAEEEAAPEAEEPAAPSRPTRPAKPSRGGPGMMPPGMGMPPGMMPPGMMPPGMMPPTKAKPPRKRTAPKKPATAERALARTAEKPAAGEAEAEEEEEFDEEAAEAEEAVRKYMEYRQKLAEAEERFAKDVERIVEPGSIDETGWVEVTRDMSIYRTEPKAEDILAKGMPKEDGRQKETDEVAPPPEKEKGKKKKEKKAVKSALPSPVAGGAKKSGGLPDLPGPGGAGGEVDLDAKYQPGVEPVWYAWLDKDIEENSAYRYRMVVYLKGRDIPEELREFEEHKDYQPRIENADLSWVEYNAGNPEPGGFFALRASLFEAFLKSEKKTKGAEGMQPTEGLEQIARDAKSRLVTELVDLQGNKTARGLEFAKGDGFSLFTYTDIVLAPIEKRIMLSSASAARTVKGTTLQASFKVGLVSGTETKTSKTYLLGIPDTVKAFNETPDRMLDWLRKDAAGKVVWEGDVPARIGLAEYYGRIEEVVPTPIGEKETIGAKEWDFSTGWGLVDVRECKVVKSRYKVGEDGQLSPIGAPTTSTQYYAIIREIKGEKPRYRRLKIRPPAEPAAKEGKEVVKYDYLWEPQLEEWSQKELGKRKGEAPKPAAKAEGAAPVKEAAPPAP